VEQNRGEGRIVSSFLDDFNCGERLGREHRNAC